MKESSNIRGYFQEFIESGEPPLWEVCRVYLRAKARTEIDIQDKVIRMMESAK